MLEITQYYLTLIYKIPKTSNSLNNAKVSFAAASENALNVIIKVTETNINAVTVGTPAKILVPSTGLSYDGTVATISPSADEKTGMFYIKMNINNQDDKIKVGIIIPQTLSLREHKTYFSIYLGTIKKIIDRYTCLLFSFMFLNYLVSNISLLAHLTRI